VNVILSEAKDLFDATVSQKRSFVVFATQDDAAHVLAKKPRMFPSGSVIHAI